MAAREGGGDPNFNPRLRTVLLNAKAANMPSDNVERAILKGTGELPGMVIEEVLYEGYAPHGVALLMEVATDNKNRSVGEVRSTLAKNGGNLSGTNTVAFQFQRMGQFIVAADASTEEALMEITLDAGAEDIRVEDGFFEILCPVEAFYAVSQALEQNEIVLQSRELSYIPQNTVPIADPQQAAQVLKVIDLLEDLDDVQNVHSNLDVSEEVMAQLDG